MIRMVINGQTVEFETVQDAIAFAKAMGLGPEGDGSQPVEPSAPKVHQVPSLRAQLGSAAAAAAGTTENRHGVPEALWNDLRKDVYRQALNIIIEVGPSGVLVADLAEKIDYNPKGIGGLLNAIRTSAQRAGLDPDAVLKSERLFVGGKEQSILKTTLKK